MASRCSARSLIPTGRALVAAGLGLMLVGALGCGPKILEQRAVAKPDPQSLRPGPSPEEVAGEVPPLRDLLPPMSITPDTYALIDAPDDPRPTLPEAPPPPPAPEPASADSAGEGDEERASDDDSGWAPRDRPDSEPESSDDDNGWAPRDRAAPDEAPAEPGG